jgi:thioredoxin
MKKFLTLGFVLLIAAFTVATQSQCQQSNHSGEPITTAEFDKVIAGDKLVMVDFYTTWCGPCKKMAPFIEQVREKQSDIVTVLKVDAEAQMDIADRYRLEGYPTVIFFKKGQVIGRSLGYTDFDGLMALVNKMK